MSADEPMIALYIAGAFLIALLLFLAISRAET